MYGSALPGPGGGERVTLTLLGPLTAEVDGRTVALGGPRQRAVLARLLVARGAVVPVDRLIEDLWSGRPPAKAAASLQAYVSNLRRLLEPARGPREPARLLVSRAPGYALELPGTDLDAWEFEARMREAGALVPFARQLADRGGEPPSRTLAAALALWRGPALAEFADQPWARTEIARLDELHVSARELAVEAALAEDRPGDAVPDARALVDDHPLREEARRLLALALWGAGRQAEALDALRAARAVLTEELGLDPHPALAALETAILNQHTDLLPSVPAPLPPPVRGAAPRHRNAPPGPIFVGRDEELRTLRRAAREVEAGEHAVAVVSGEAGAGKSTLLGRVRAELHDAGWLVAAGRCPETEGAPPAWAWTEALRELAGQAPLPDPLARQLAPLLGGEPARPAGLPQADALAGRFRLHRAVGDWLRRVAAGRPVAVLLDDLHEADQETRALLVALSAARLPGLLLVVAHRPGEGELTDVLAVLARRSPYRLPLAGLAEEEAGRLIGSVCPAEVDPGTVRALAERTGGNPFYLLESAHLLAGEGALVAVQEVPQGVRDVLRRRFSRLPGATVEALRLAAVVGREAEVDLLLAASGQSEERLLDALEAALVGGLLTEPRPGTVRFIHALVRDTLYADLSSLRRTRLHGRVAGALGTLRPDRLTALAHHYSRAASAATAELAVDHCVRAAEAAERRYAHESCAALLRQALDALDLVPEGADDRPARRLALLGALLRAQVRAGAVAAALATRAAAVGLARESGRADLLIEAWTAWTEPTPWVAHPYGSVDQAAIDALTALLRRDDLPPVTRCRLLDALTYELDCSGSQGGREAGAEAVRIAREVGDPRLLARALAAQARVHDYEHDLDLRTEIADELIELAQEFDLPAYRWHAEHLHATAAAVRADLPALRAHIDAGLRIAEAYGLPELVDVGLCQQGMMALVADRPAEAEALYVRAVGGLRSRGSLHADGFDAVYRLTLAIQGGRLRDELPLVRAAAAIYGPLVDDVLALALAQDGRIEEARAARTPRRPITLDYYRSFFLVLRAMVVMALDERAEAAEVLAELAEVEHLVAGAASTSIALRPVALVRGELARYLGLAAQAAGHFRTAAEVARRWESPRWETEAFRALAELGPDL
ncbi:BTAD domain-containing putative transcriptional regulator [Kitasatospora sp. NPDC088346]|uniref:BTAD domain-containing putative transcriptional regulator n=1 Tax=Kitasatospora sp. NPDC088346 TaxID=3364073 RepID=UPI003800A072